MKINLLVILVLQLLFVNQLQSQSISWTETQPAGDANQSWRTVSMNSDGTKLIAGYDFGKLYLSTNSGNSWVETQPAGNVTKRWNKSSISSDGTKLFVAVFNGRLYVSTNSGSSWTETQPAGNVNKPWRAISMSSNGSTLIAGVDGGRLYISTNTGSTWTETQPAGDADKAWYTCATDSDGTTMIAGLYNGRIYISTNSGSSWAETQPAGNVNRTWWSSSMSSDGTKIMAGNTNASPRLYISTNRGSSWTEAQPAGDVDASWRTTSISSDGTTMIAGVDGGRLWISTNDGANWTETRPAGDVDKAWYVSAINSDATKYISGVNGGRLYLSDQPLPVELTSFSAKNNEDKVILNWETATEVNNYGFEVQRKNEKGKSWEEIGFIAGYGTSNIPHKYTFIDNNTYGGLKFNYRLKQIDIDGKFEYSGILTVVLTTPQKAELMQNSPNPFNPTTTIKYSIPNISASSGVTQQLVDVSLKIYDILGREVAVLVNNKQTPGNYKVEFNGNDLPSGVYLYRLTVDNLIKLKKMILIK